MTWLEWKSYGLQPMRRNHQIAAGRPTLVRWLCSISCEPAVGDLALQVAEAPVSLSGVKL